MSNLNKVILSLQKIKSKNHGQNQENLVHYLLKYYSFSNNEEEILIIDAVKANAIKSIIFNGKASYRIVKTDNVSDVRYYFLTSKKQKKQNKTKQKKKHQKISPLKMLLFLMKLILSQQQGILRQTPYQMNKK